METLPDSLHEAIAAAESSELVRSALGDHVFESLLKNKKLEWAEYRAHVTELEHAGCLPVM